MASDLVRVDEWYDFSTLGHGFSLIGYEIDISNMQIWKYSQSYVAGIMD